TFCGVPRMRKIHGCCLGGMVAFLLLTGLVLSQDSRITIPPDKALIVLRVPADARITVGGYTLPDKGPERTFFSQTGKPGANYFEEAEAAWKKKGQERKIPRRVSFQVGRMVQADLRPGTIDPVPTAPKAVEKKGPETKVETKKVEEKKVE